MTKRRSSSLFTVVLVATAMACLALPAFGAARAPAGLPANSSLLFALSGKDGQLEAIGRPRRREYKLTLNGVDKDVLWFADRPRRDAGRLSAPGFFGDWAPLGFKKTAPNGALVVAGAKAGQDTMALALHLRRYDRRTRSATFTARALGSVGGGLRHLEKRLDPRVPGQFGNASLFIDNGEYLSGCTEARPQLMAVETQTLRQNYQELIGFIAAAGQQLAIDQNEALYSLIGPSFEEEGFSTTSFQLPDLQGPVGTSWYLCSNGIYPAQGELGGAILGEVAFFPEWIAGRANRNWLPADGRWINSNEYPEYDRAVAGSAALYQLPTVPAPAGMKAMVAMEAGIVPDASVGQIRMFVGEPPEKETEESAAVEWAPAEGQTVSASEYPGLANLLAGGAESKATKIKLPSVPSPAPGVRWFVSMSGAWPLHAL